MYHLPFTNFSPADLPFGCSLDSLIENIKQLPFESVQNRSGSELRQSCWITSPNCNCSYKYGNRHFKPSDPPEWLNQLTSRIMQICGLQEYHSDGINCNFYEDGSLSLPEHADDEELFATQSGYATVISLSLGSTRPFSFRHKFINRPSYISLATGDIAVMTGRMQDHYLHAIPACNSLGPRWNLTWRFIMQHTEGCPAKINSQYLAGPHPPLQGFSGIFTPPS